MSGWRTSVLDVREIVRRLRLDEAERRIARDLSLSRNTVAKYRAWATKSGFLERNAPLPDLQTLEAALPSDPIETKPGPVSSVAPVRSRNSSVSPEIRL